MNFYYSTKNSHYSIIAIMTVFGLASSKEKLPVGLPVGPGLVGNFPPEPINQFFPKTNHLYQNDHNL